MAIRRWTIAFGKIAKIQRQKPDFNQTFDKISRPTEHPVCTVHKNINKTHVKNEQSKIDSIEYSNDAFATCIINFREGNFHMKFSHISISRIVIFLEKTYRQFSLCFVNVPPEIFYKSDKFSFYYFCIDLSEGSNAFLQQNKIIYTHKTSMGIRHWLATIVA